MPIDPLDVLVVDDELLARQRLLDLLSDRDYVSSVATAENGDEATRMLQEDEPDLVFLDVQMPGLSGLDVVRKVGPDEMPVTIFVTAYDDYALEAFDLAALDYLLKPFDDDRFDQAFDRALETIARNEADSLRKELRELIREQPEGGAADGETNEKHTLKRLAVESRNETLIISVADIRYISASGPYLEIHTGDDTYLLRERMKTLDENLDDNFFRIHRSTIVQLDRIESLVSESSGRYAVKLDSGETLPVSRRRRSSLEELLGLSL